MDKTRFLDPLKQIESFNQILGELTKKGATSALCTGTVDGQKSHLLWAFAQDSFANRPFVVLTHSEARAKEIAADLGFFAGDVLYFPVLDFMAGYVDVASKDVLRQRLFVLDALMQGGTQPLVATMEALTAGISPPDTLAKAVIKIADGDEINLTQLAGRLVDIGYERAQQVEGHGQFAIRGGIVDIFCPLAAYPVRIELWGDEVDSIRFVDPLTQRSIDGEKPADIQFFPMKEYFGGEPSSLFDYLSKNTIIFVDEANRCAVRLDEMQTERTLFLQDLIEKGRIAPEDIAKSFDYPDIVRLAEAFDVVMFNLMAQSVRDFKPKLIAHFEGKAVTTYAGRIDLLAEDIDYFSTQGYEVFLLAPSEAKAARLREDINYSNVHIMAGDIANGFEYPQAKFAVMPFADSAAAPKRKKTRSLKRKKGLAIEHFTDLNTGDYVVHDSLGIGQFLGLEKIAIDGFFRDYLKIGYRGESNLYVAVNQMDVLQKYIGGENAKPQLSRLGGDAWTKTKARVRAEVEEVAKELVELYAKREAVQGFAFEKDTVWQTEFEDSFTHEETDDQLLAIEDVKRDMENPRVMDRLVCGDVGYGKTEVAIRAAFKAVNDQKQVAFLCPTTILAQQHYNTFVQRMKDYPINIQVASRFRSATETKKILADVQSGKVDILIGTHRLLSKDVTFKNLGLIVVDEEQRFGVMHKEKLKQNWANVDVLTLTATPIPRTLHMSLAGIRDMSILNEPPLERQPIQTYVMEYSPEMVRSAINRELARGGQVYYLHNRVQNIADTAAKVQKLVPEATVAYAHGRMNERELENIMMDFIDGEIDVLVCTTIVESGLDIPNVNTIIIQDADRLGLAQLYQLRGRVGRSGRSSFAYLMYQKDKVLTEVAEKRLQTIREYTEFGAGFKIAMRDLEIRGAGNMLGVSQHGHMDAVGYDMYCKLLDTAVRELRGMEMPNDFETTIDLNIDAFIPASYIAHENTRLEIYKKISHIATLTDYYDMQEEMEDRFGTLPPTAQNLLDIALLKARANAADIIAIKQTATNVKIIFKQDAKADPLQISNVVQRSGGVLKFTLSTTPFLTYKTKENESVIAPISDIISVLS
ncbi:MAG: transcription-repair coupling factor [Defluviitaleaceae bacterium]|nr:transcription-repair coupling factor [Defluviitaleaceae bacterium]